MGNQYIDQLNTMLMPKSLSSLRVLDLFAGCGGLALGFEAQGFSTYGFEKDADAVQTYISNLAQPCEKKRLTMETKYPEADIVIGGPPCQPFSVGGHQNGVVDPRDGFPIFIKAIESIRPKLWVFENVRGLLYQNKSYLEKIIAQLATLGYVVDAKILNAAHYGVPQNRERLIVVGHQGGYKFPKPLNYQVTAGDALGEMATTTPSGCHFLTASMDTYVAKYEKASCCRIPRDLHLNKPSRTLTCRNIAAPTGDMMRVRLPDGRRRRILVREAARLQSFPDWFEFMGNEKSQYYQIGNAVPPLLAYAIAGSIITYLEHFKNVDMEHSRMDKAYVVQLNLFIEDEK